MPDAAILLRHTRLLRHAHMPLLVTPIRFSFRIITPLVTPLIEGRLRAR